MEGVIKDLCFIDSQVLNSKGKQYFIISCYSSTFKSFHKIFVDEFTYNYISSFNQFESVAEYSSLRYDSKNDCFRLSLKYDKD